jgi:hypothetical protein
MHSSLASRLEKSGRRGESGWMGSGAVLDLRLECWRARVDARGMFVLQEHVEASCSAPAGAVSVVRTKVKGQSHIGKGNGG